jgi:hypothetical protein
MPVFAFSLASWSLSIIHRSPGYILTTLFY